MLCLALRFVSLLLQACCHISRALFRQRALEQMLFQAQLPCRETGVGSRGLRRDCPTGGDCHSLPAVALGARRARKTTPIFESGVFLQHQCTIFVLLWDFRHRELLQNVVDDVVILSRQTAIWIAKNADYPISFVDVTAFMAVDPAP